LQFDADISKQGKLLLSTGNPYLQLDSDVGTILSFSTEENYL
jgi:hypothetical protein